VSNNGSIAYLETEIAGGKRTFSIPKEFALCIGRSTSVGVPLEDEDVSRRHALVQRTENDQYYITDLGSRNGTHVNSKRISAPLVLKPGDRISIGSHTLTFCHQAERAPGTTSSTVQSTGTSFAPGIITVMVADNRDFTGLAQRVAPGPLSVITGTLFRRGGKALQDHGAWAQKYIGDAVMAVWLHGSLERGATDLRPVFEAISRLFEIAGSLQFSLNLEEPIRLGVGINTGWASVGNVGSIASSDYTAVGEVVNKAFRLESATRELDCDLALGQETYDLLAGAIDREQIFKTCSVKLKGYKRAVAAYTLPLASLPGLLKQLRIN
jgi:adenylate cyclase